MLNRKQLADRNRLVLRAPVTDLLPSHGNPIRAGVRAAIRKTRGNLALWAEVKEKFVSGVRVKLWKGEVMGHGIRRLLPQLYHLAGSAYLLAGKTAAGLLIDAVPAQSKAVRHAMKLAQINRLTTAFHYSALYFRTVQKWAAQYRDALENLHHPGEGAGYFSRMF